MLALRAADPAGGTVKTEGRGVPLDPAWEVEERSTSWATWCDVVTRRQAGLGGGAGGRAVAGRAGLDPRRPARGQPADQPRRLSGVIDWGGIGLADPAPDVVPAWTLFEGAARQRYRELLAVDDATWARARAWAMLPALTGLTYYATSVPAFSQRSRRHLDAVLGDPTLGR